jgi:putative glutamine amidotransferase
MPPRIAIPMPHSSDREYAKRAIPQYERAVELAGGEPVRIPLERTPTEIMKMIESCDGVLLPGSNADVDPARFSAARSAHTASADLPREAIDELLLEDAFARRKPVLGICYGLQSLNVYRKGSLVQHIPDFLPQDLRARVNHEAGKTVPVAHTVEIEPESILAKIVGAAPTKNRERPGFGRGDAGLEKNPASAAKAPLVIAVNSSHHQSADAIGDGLRVVARCVEDGIIEAAEGTARDHFVLAVQWHPERSVDQDEPSLAIFKALVGAAAGRPGN